MTNIALRGFNIILNNNLFVLLFISWLVKYSPISQITLLSAGVLFSRITEWICLAVSRNVLIYSLFLLVLLLLGEYASVYLCYFIVLDSHCMFVIYLVS